MRPGHVVLAILIGVLVGVATRAAELPRRPFAPGEELTLEVRYLAMHAADVKVSVNELTLDGRDVWPIEVSGRTRGLASALHDIEATFVSYFDPDDGESAGWDQDESVNGQDTQERVRYAGASASVRRVRDGKVTNATRSVAPGAHDILSAIFLLRTRELVEGSPISIPVFTGKQNWNLEGSVVGREAIEVGGRRWDTIVVRCRTKFDGKFSSDRDVVIWLSADSRRIPVKVEADFLIGTMRATLERYRGGELAQR